MEHIKRIEPNRFKISWIVDNYSSGFSMTMRKRPIEIYFDKENDGFVIEFPRIRKRPSTNTKTKWPDKVLINSDIFAKIIKSSESLILYDSEYESEYTVTPLTKEGFLEFEEVFKIYEINVKRKITIEKWDDNYNED